MSKAQFLADNQRGGEIYAGLILGQNGEADYHLFVVPGEAEFVNWNQAKEFAQTVGGDLPTRREQRVLFANANAAFKASWNLYWSSEQYADNGDCAWFQTFLNGAQQYNRKYIFLRARAVRRLVI